MKIINYLIKVFLVSVVTLNCYAAPTSTPAFTPEQNKAVEQAVHDYLVKNPEVLVEAMQTMQQKHMAQMEQDSKKMLARNAKEVFNAANNPVAGNTKGSIVITEVFDYRCSHCKAMDSVMKKVMQNNPDLKIIYMSIPFGEESMYASKAMLAAMKQNKHLELHAALLNSSNALTKDEVLKMAKSINIDIAKLEKDIQDQAMEKQLTANIALAKKMKVPGTPAFFIGSIDGKKHEAIYGQFGPEVLQQKIDSVK